MLEASNPTELEALRPGDMVFTKLGSFPWWPATVSFCTQKNAKGKNQFRVGTDPQKSKLWVQFFNENSGAFVFFNRTRVFDPKDADSLRVKPSSAHYDKQRIAIDMAIQDFYRINGQPEEFGNDTTIRKSPKIANTTSDSQTASHQASEVKVGATSSAKKRKRNVDEVETLSKHRKSRVVKPPPEETDTDDDEHESDIDNNDSVDDKEDFPMVNKSSAKVERELPQPSRSLREKPDASAVRLSQIRSLERTLQEKDAVIERRNSQIVELERKLRKLRPKSGSEKIRITLPDLPPEIAVNLPPRSEYGVNPVGAEKFTALIGKVEHDFASFERVCLEALKADESLTSEAKRAVASLQPLYDRLRDASESVLQCEQQVADSLKSLYKAKVTSSDIISCDAGKKVNRISRRSAGNSALLTGLASAVRREWVVLFEQEKGESNSSTHDGKVNVSRDASTDLRNEDEELAMARNSDGKRKTSGQHAVKQDAENLIYPKSPKNGDGGRCSGAYKLAADNTNTKKKKSEMRNAETEASLERTDENGASIDIAMNVETSPLNDAEANCVVQKAVTNGSAHSNARRITENEGDTSHESGSGSASDNEDRLSD